MPLTGWGCTDSFENFRDNSLKRGLSNDITLNPPLFSLVNTFKGSLTQDFLFFTNQFPHGPEYHMGAISNFYENSQISSIVKVNHRCQQPGYRFWDRKLSIFFLKLLGCSLRTDRGNFSKTFILRCRQADIHSISFHTTGDKLIAGVFTSSNKVSLVSLLLTINYRRYHCYRRLI